MTGSDDSLTARSPQRHEQKFEARVDQVREARHFLAGVLNGCPATDDVLLVASELVTNAVKHSASGRPCGTFTLAAEVCEGDHVRVEARDDGGAWRQGEHKPVLPNAEFGRGLSIVAALAADHGVSGDQQAGWIAWAVLPWHPAPFPEPLTERTPRMTDDTSPASNLVPPPGLYVWGAFACLRIVRCAMWCRVMSPRRALRLTEPWSEAATLAGIKLPERFYETAAQAGLELPGAPAPPKL